MSQAHRDQVSPLASLEDASRRRLYDHVVSQSQPVTRDEVAGALGIGRSVVAYHLDMLVEHGLLTATFARPAGRRGGPGAGRPAKHYQRSTEEFSVSVPPRDYELAADVLARAAEHDPQQVIAALDRAARDRGQELAEGVVDGSLEGVLREHGYEPHRDECGALRLRNCPFHRLAQEHTALICGMNLAMLRGLLDRIEDAGHEARLEPDAERCCVVFRMTE